METTEQTPTPGRGLDGLYAALRRPGVARVSQGRWFAGVAGGIARWLGVDPLVVRAGFILFGLFFGVGLGLYLALVLLLPDEQGTIRLEQALRHGDGKSIFLLVVTALVLFGGPWDGDSQGFRIGGFVVIGLVAWWFLTRTQTGQELRRSAPWAGAPPAEQPASSTTPTMMTMPTAPSPTAAPSPGLSTGNAAANAGRPAATWAPRPLRERTPVIGFAAALLVVGAALLVGALGYQLARVGTVAGNPLPVGIASGLAVLGLGVLVAGLVGRRAGGLAPLAILGVLAALVTSAAPAGLTQPFSTGDRTETVTTLTGNDSYQLGLGALVVDLTNADVTPSGVERVTTSLGVGQLDIIVPEGVRVVVTTSGRGGEVIATGSDRGPQYQLAGSGWTETFAYGTGPTELIVDAEVGLGQINVRTGSSS
ncbi:MAG: PspC domain-containing protein [Terracoccus sp.]